MNVPEVRSEARLATVDRLKPEVRRSRYLSLVTAIAAGLVALVGFVALWPNSTDTVSSTSPSIPSQGIEQQTPSAAISQDQSSDSAGGTEPTTEDDSPASTAATSGAEWVFTTRSVELTASLIEVTVPDMKFQPPLDADGGGDPGGPDYATLELEWDDDGIPMRINLYFAADETDWWVDEIRTYDGTPRGEWIEYTGEWFRTPLGEAFVGELQLDSLVIEGMTLEAFFDPRICSTADEGLALDPVYTPIKLDLAGGFGAGAELLNVVDCSPVGLDEVTITVVSADESIATVDSIDKFPVGGISFGLTAVRLGETSVTIEVKDLDSVTLAEATIPVIVGQENTPLTEPTG